MREDQRTIGEVVRKMRQTHGEEILVVRCNDGTYGISRNGALIPSLQWSPEQLAECIAFAERFSHTDFHGEAEFAPHGK